ncbi:ATP-binding protein [Candidatus Sumerlaeota bacterium]|nr:ATP-binding protein [Candidatus Sumerlaeota bacterium]MBI3736135.1 ATP-binding protein [Candidatus Sumerlaeota bacterium]
MIDRKQALKRIHRAFRAHPAVALEGPRQCGKTTLARAFMAGKKNCAFFDLEKPVDRRKLETPEQTLGGLRGWVVLDEIQRKPELFEFLRVLLDRPSNPARFLLLGSASPSLIRGVSESLAGRVGLIDLGGFDLRETGAAHWRKLWLRGGFPRSFLAVDDAASAEWRESFEQTFLERDMPQFGITIPAETLRRFWTMLAHYHGQVWNAAEFARALGSSEATARRYLDILAGAFMVRVLPPWFENMKKRQVKAPKIYVRDSGLMHTLQDVQSADDLAGHPKLGASWEGFAIEQILACLGTQSATFWGTHGGAELDLLVTVRGKRHGFECKYADAPGSTRSMQMAIQDLSLAHLWIVYPGKERYNLGERLTAIPVSEIPALAEKLGNPGS